MSMKLHKVLTVAGVQLPLVQDEVRLQLKHPGRASFTVQAGAPVKGLVTLDIGYNDRPLQRHFIGYVERSTAVNGQQQILFCRELATALGGELQLHSSPGKGTTVSLELYLPACDAPPASATEAAQTPSEAASVGQ